MNRLYETSRRRIRTVSTRYIRDINTKISWKSRLIGIRGAKGCGKTTLMLQHIRGTFTDEMERVLYLSLDNIWFADHSLVDLADTFVKRGGTHLFLDEVHKYPRWSQEIKNLYDDHPDLHIVFTGSSLLDLLHSRADLSRRALMYDLPGLSFREFLSIETGFTYQALSMEELLTAHTYHAERIVEAIRPYVYFDSYLEHGYYPYYLEGVEEYPARLHETILVILEHELPLLRHIDPSYIPKLKKLLTVIAESAPFLPNVTKLSERIGINRQTFLNYLRFLEETTLIRMIFRNSRGLSALQKPDKIFLGNTNLIHLLSPLGFTRGALRETFIASQVSYVCDLRYSVESDFFVDGQYTIEVGGKNKTRKQLRGLDDAYIAADDIEVGHGRTIPLWLFGFLY